MPGVVERVAAAERAGMLADNPPVLADYDAIGIGMNLDRTSDRTGVRTVFRDTLRSRAISLIVLPLRKCSRRNPPNRLHCQHSPPPASNQSEQRIRPNGRGSILDADNPAQGVENCTPKHR